MGKDEDMKIALVFPRFGMISKFRHILEPPLGLAYMAAVLRQNGIDVKIFDGTFYSIDSLIDKIINYKPEIIGFYTNCIMIEDALFLAKKVKSVFPQIPLIFGGPQSSATPERILKNKNVDIVVIGEGEYTILDLANKLHDLRAVKGIYYKENEKIIKNNPREFIKNLDSLPFPAYDLLDSRYLKNLEKTVVGSRGCVFNCAFCQPTLRKIFGFLRLRSPQNIVDEIEMLVKKYNTQRILFHDDTFTLNKKWLISICKEIIKRRLRIRWICNSRVDTIDIEMLGWMKRAGCRTIEFGVESGSDFIRNSVLKKGTTKEQIKKTFLLCHKVRIKAAAYIMIGNPGETKKTLYETIELLKEINPEMIGVFLTTPMPGTYLYDFCKEKKIIKAKKWNDFDFSNKTSIKYKHINEKDLEKIKNKIKFMSWSNYVLFSIKTLNFRELIEEIFVEPKRIQNIIGQIFLGGI